MVVKTFEGEMRQRMVLTGKQASTRSAAVIRHCELIWAKASEAGDFGILKEIRLLLAAIVEIRQLLAAFRHASVVEGDDGVASLLGVNKNTIYNKLKSFGLSRGDFRAATGVDELVFASSYCRGLIFTVSTYAQEHGVPVLSSDSSIPTGPPSGDLIQLSSDPAPTLFELAGTVLSAVVQRVEKIGLKLRHFALEFDREREPEKHIAIFLNGLQELCFELRYSLPPEFFAPHSTSLPHAWVVLGMSVRSAETLAHSAFEHLSGETSAIVKSPSHAAPAAHLWRRLFAAVSQKLLAAADQIQVTADDFFNRLLNDDLPGCASTIEHGSRKDSTQRESLADSLVENLKELANQLATALVTDQFEESCVCAVLQNINGVVWTLCEELQFAELDAPNLGFNANVSSLRSVEVFLDVAGDIQASIEGRILNASVSPRISPGFLKTVEAIDVRVRSVVDRCKCRKRDLEMVLQRAERASSAGAFSYSTVRAAHSASLM